MKYFIVLLFAAVCYARPQGTYDYTPRQQSHQQHGLSNGSPGGLQVTKHVYLHAPPEDHSEQFNSQQAPAPPPQKHYKIIFIKAPSAPSQEQFASPQLPLVDEKTIVYVLVKRPDEQLNLDSAPQNEFKPTKPEVYFIKYKSKTQPQHGGGNQFNSGAQPAFGGSGTSSSFLFGGGQQGGHGGNGGHGRPQPPSTSYGTPSNPPSNNYAPPELPNLPDNSYGPPHK